MLNIILDMPLQESENPMVEPLFRRTAPLTPAQSLKPVSTPEPVAEAAVVDVGAAQASRLSLGLRSGTSPLQTPDLSFPPPEASGMQELQGMLGGIPGDMGAFFQAVMQGRVPRDIPLQRGQNFAVATIFTTRDAAGIRNLTQALDFVSRATATPPERGYRLNALPAEMKDALRRAGLMVSRGKLVNMLNFEQVDAAQLRALSRLAAHQAIACGPAVAGETPGETTMRRLSSGLMSATLRIGALRTVQSALADSTHSLDQLSEDLDHTQREIGSQLGKVESLSGQVEAARTDLQVIQASARGLQANPADWLADDTRRQQTLRLLQQEGIQLRVGLGTPFSFRDRDGQTLSLPQVLVRLQQAEQRQAAAVAGQSRELDRETRTLTSLGDRSEQLEIKLDAAIQSTELLQAEHAEQLEDVERLLPEMRAAAADAGRPAAEREAFADLARQGRRQLDRGAALNRHALDGIARSRRVLATAQVLHQRLNQLIAQLPALIAQRLHRELGQLAEENDAAEATQRLEALQQQAAEIEATLQLAPAPEAVDKLLEQWTHLLQDISQPFERLEQHSRETARIQQDWSSSMLNQVQERLTHHLRQLRQFDVRNAARTEALLKASVQGFLAG